MTDMVCDRCGRTGIAWVGPLDNPTGTRCPHCGGENCQRAFQDGDEDEFECPICEGFGFVETDDEGTAECTNCDGDGSI